MLDCLERAGRSFSQIWDHEQLYPPLFNPVRRVSRKRSKHTNPFNWHSFMSPREGYTSLNGSRPAGGTPHFIYFVRDVSFLKVG